MVDWVSLSIPVAYTTILVGSLAAFSWAYRRRQAVHAASLEPWFGQHLQRDIYYTLWNQVDGGGDVKVPESILKAALLRRAAEDVSRIIQMRGSKQALTNLLARGSVGDDLMQRFNRAEKELEAELQDVVSEANALSPGWGQVIFQSANEMAANTRLRKRLEEIQSTKTSEREWWSKKQAATRTEFLKEIDAEPTPTSDERRDSAAPSSAGGDDEDGVLVEATGSGDNATGPNTPSTPTGAGEGGGKKKNKKKGKK